MDKSLLELLREKTKLSDNRIAHAINLVVSGWREALVILSNITSCQNAINLALESEKVGTSAYTVKCNAKLASMLAQSEDPHRSMIVFFEHAFFELNKMQKLHYSAMVHPERYNLLKKSAENKYAFALRIDPKKFGELFIVCFSAWGSVMQAAWEISPNNETIYTTQFIN